MLQLTTLVKAISDSYVCVLSMNAVYRWEKISLSLSPSREEFWKVVARTTVFVKREALFESPGLRGEDGGGGGRGRANVAPVLL